MIFTALAVGGYVFWLVVILLVIFSLDAER